jgi:AcrR family transcriptional regulator
MTKNDLSTRRAILEAAVTCIEKFGIDRMTTRRIAQEAGTNIASINYHFRTKDQLVAEALTMTANHMLEDVFAEIEVQGTPFRQILENVLFYLIDGGLQFPRTTTAHLYRAVVEKEYDSPGAVALQRAFDRLATRATEELPHEDPARVRFLLSHLLGSIMFTMLAPNFFKLKRPYQPADSARRRRLSEEYAGMFFTSLRSGQAAPVSRTAA